MTKPIVSKDFNLEDIRKIREYNSLRHVGSGGGVGAAAAKRKSKCMIAFPERRPEKTVFY